MALQCAFVLVMLLQKWNETVGRGQYFVAAGEILAMVLFASRAMLTGSSTALMNSHMASSDLQTATFLVSAIILILVTMGFVLMTKERSDERNLFFAMSDELTGLPNRRFIIESLAQQMAQAQRSNLPLTLLMIDIDHFKRINENFGHLSGDQALQNLSMAIRTRIRTQDILGRFGGEEFLVILPNTTAEHSYQVAENLREGIAASRFMAVDGRTMPVTISIGLYRQDLEADRHCDDMISAADQALHSAKESGRNRVEVFDSRVQLNLDSQLFDMRDE
jgi:diguanylate cyclase (GGDEF)-like protein